MRAGPLNLEELDRAYLCIVQLRTQTPGVIHQVTLRPDKIHDGFIRLGETPNDEAAGWQYPANVMILSVLGYAIEDKGQWVCRPIFETETA
ncbi:MAG: hypothetical protein U1E51_26990 [Candidatus Binatia bacterium]|nr:hypothetical protein [Candidatus Binatia bacterium]